MKIAFVYFPDFTLLDVVGVYDPLWRLKSLNILPELTIESHGYHAATVYDNHSFPSPTLLLRQPLSNYDLVFVPGGMGTRPLRYDKGFLNWLSSASESLDPATPGVAMIASVCTGSLLLGAAGLLNGHRATTHYNEYESLREFLPEASVVEGQELVDDGRVVTAGAVASSLLLGLHLCERLAGAEARERVARSMNFAVK